MRAQWNLFQEYNNTIDTIIYDHSVTGSSQSVPVCQLTMAGGTENRAYHHTEEDWYSWCSSSRNVTWNISRYKSPAVETYKKQSWRERYSSGLSSLIPVRSKQRCASYMCVCVCVLYVCGRGKYFVNLTEKYRDQFRAHAASE